MNCIYCKSNNIKKESFLKRKMPLSDFELNKMKEMIDDEIVYKDETLMLRRYKCCDCKREYSQLELSKEFKSYVENLYYKCELTKIKEENYIGKYYHIDENTYGIDPRKFKHDLSKYYNEIISNGHATFVLRNWKSVETFVNVLYGLKFEKKFTSSEMSRITGINNFYQFYMSEYLNWDYSTNDFDEMLLIKKKENEKIQIILNRYDSNSERFESLEYKMFLEKIKALPSIHFSKKVHMKTEDLCKMIYYLYVENQLTTKQLSRCFKISKNSMYRELVKMGINMTLEEASQRASKQGSRNYTKIYNNAKKRMMYSVLEGGLTGSESENHLRTILNVELINRLDRQRNVVIVGLNNSGIIPPREVDIPIIIIDNDSDKIKKIAVEFNGAHWHNQNDVKDEKKAKDLEKIDWKYFGFFYSGKSNENENSQFYREQVDLLCDNICKYVFD